MYCGTQPGGFDQGHGQGLPLFLGLMAAIAGCAHSRTNLVSPPLLAHPRTGRAATGSARDEPAARASRRENQWPDAVPSEIKMARREVASLSLSGLVTGCEHHRCRPFRVGAEKAIYKKGGALKK